MTLDPQTMARLGVVKDRTTDIMLGLRWDYYRGNQPKVYATEKLVEMFKGLADAMTDNYCGLAVNTRLARMEVTGWDPSGAAQQVWEDSRLPQRQDALFRWALTYGSAYLVASAADADHPAVLHANRPTTTFAASDPDNPFTIEYAGKMWHDARQWYAVLWDADTVRRYTQPYQGGRSSVGVPIEQFRPSVDPEWPAEEAHGFDGVPVLPILPYGEDGPVLLDSIRGTQDRINKLSANKFVAAEFGAFRQRVFFTRQELEDDQLRNRPDTAIVLDPGDPDGQARVQELSATDLANYDNSRNEEINTLFTLAALPRHLRVNPGASPSGEAIKADEAPLTEVVTDHQREMGEALRRAMSLLGIDAAPLWRNPEARNEQTDAATVNQMVLAGVPWQVAVQMYAGWDDIDVADAERVLAQTVSRDAAALGGALLA